MKELTNYRRAVQYLTKLYNLCNEYFWDGELEEVTVTIQSHPGTYAHVSISDNWFVTDKNGNTTGMKELNIEPSGLSRNIESVISSILHEQTHIFCMEHHIKDVSSNGFFHNKHFKEVAEAHGLIIDKDPNGRYGYTLTSPGPKVIDFCLEYDLEDIQISKGVDWSAFGGTPTTTTTTTKPTTPKVKPTGSNSRKWICPKCGQIIRSTRDDTNVICGDCNERFIRA